MGEGIVLGGGGFPAACLSRGNFLINKFTRLKGRKPQENWLPMKLVHILVDLLHFANETGDIFSFLSPTLNK